MHIFNYWHENFKWVAVQENYKINNTQSSACVSLLRCSTFIYKFSLARALSWWKNVAQCGAPAVGNLFSLCVSKLCKPALWRQHFYVGLVIWKQMSRKQTSVFWLTVCTSVHAPYSFDLKSFAVTVFLLPSEWQTSWCLCICYCLYFLSVLVWTVHVSLSSLIIPQLSLRMRIST